MKKGIDDVSKKIKLAEKFQQDIMLMVLFWVVTLIQGTLSGMTVSITSMADSWKMPWIGQNIPQLPHLNLPSWQRMVAVSLTSSLYQ